MSNQKISILCIGQLVADVVVRPVARLPVAGRAELVGDLQLLAGGCAANTASVLAKLGADVRLASLIGQDTLGNAVLAELETTGVCLKAVGRTASAPTSAAIVLVSDNGERSFFYRNGGSELLANSHVADSVLKAASLVHIGGALKLLKMDLAKLMNRAKSFGCSTSLDTDWDVHDSWMRRLSGALPLVDYLMTNEEEALTLTGKGTPGAAARDLLSKGPHAVVIKRGQHGAMLISRSGLTELPAYRVKVQDTTCAGDSFAAGLLLGISRGWPLEKSLTVANAAGALCTTQISHRGITCLEDLDRLINAHCSHPTLNHQTSYSLANNEASRTNLDRAMRPEPSVPQSE